MMPLMRMMTSSGSSESPQHKVKKLRYENCYATNPGSVQTEQVVINPNISYAELCDIQQKFGELNALSKLLVDRQCWDELEENIESRKPLGKTIMSYFEFQEPRMPNEAIAATQKAYNRLRNETLVSFPAWEDSTIDYESVEYIMSHYGEGGWSALFFSPSLSEEEVVASYRLYVIYCAIYDEYFDIDTMGREQIRNLMLLARRCPPNEELPGYPHAIGGVCRIVFPE